MAILNPNASEGPHTPFMSQTGYSVSAAVMGLFSVCGVILNVLVIAVTVRHRQLRQPLSYALVNLAVCDLGCAVFGGLPTAVMTAQGHFSLGRAACVLEGFAVAFFGIASLCTVAVISIERYVVVCYSMGSVLFQTRHAAAGVVLSWAWSFVWNTPPLFGWGSYELEGIRTSCAPAWSSRDTGNMSYVLMYLSLCFLLPFSIILVSYTRLLWTLQKVKKLQACEGGSLKQVEVQVARMVLVMVLTFLVTWLPYASMALTIVLDPSLHVHPVLATVPVFLAKSSTVYNPIIYIFMNRQFQNYAVPAILCGWNPWTTEGPQSEAETTVSSISKNQRVSPKESIKE